MEFENHPATIGLNVSPNGSAVVEPFRSKHIPRQPGLSESPQGYETTHIGAGSKVKYWSSCTKYAIAKPKAI